MRRCDRCHIDYAGELDRCPLCAAQLTGEPAPSPFPVSTWYRLSRTMRHVLVVSGILVVAAAVVAWLAFGIPAFVLAAAAGAVLFVAVKLLLTQGPLGARLSKFFSLR